MMIQPRGTLRIAALLAILAPALTGCFVQSPQSDAPTTPVEPERTSQETDDPAAPSSGDSLADSATATEKSSAAADITITVTPEKSAKAEAIPDAQALPDADTTAEEDINAVAEAVDAAIEQLNQADETNAQQPDDTAGPAEQAATSQPPADGASIEKSINPTAAEAAPSADLSPEQEAPAILDNNANQPEPSLHAVKQLCDEIGNKLGSVSVGDCMAIELQDSGARSRLSRSLMFKEYPQVGDKNSGRVLLMGGIHGDEFSSVSIIFKWLQFIHQEQANEFNWQVVPLLNPDGLLRDTSQRQNDAGVDLNRNFPSPDWRADALRYWENRTGSNPRRYPGPEAASEPETQWFIDTIEAFHPDAIVAVHAPHSLVDYDGPQKPPNRLGKLHLQELGIYPGSLGNYAGVYKNIPVVTIELPSAGIMPTRNDINLMWQDLIKWLQKEVPKQRLARTESEPDTSSATP